MDDMERDLGDEYGWKQVEINGFIKYRLDGLLIQRFVEWSVH